MHNLRVVRSRSGAVYKSVAVNRGTRLVFIPVHAGGICDVAYTCGGGRGEP